MICAGFLAAADLQEGKPDVLLLAVRRLVGTLPSAQKLEILRQLGAAA
jgi:hypothetical protein